ncbi:MAG: hypothetical protein QM802_01815 [Agriterribacter sp.]
MRITIYALLVGICACTLNYSYSQSNQFDSVLAKKLGADEYGMKQYVMAFLKSAPLN